MRRTAAAALAGAAVLTVGLPLFGGAAASAANASAANASAANARAAHGHGHHAASGPAGPSVPVDDSVHSCGNTPVTPTSKRLPLAGWGQRALDLPAAWQVSQGQGVTVAVLDSGIDPQTSDLSGRVQAIDLTGTGVQDCDGHGTAVASLIAGSIRPGRFSGVAPRASILAVKVQSGARSKDGSVTLAAGIRDAVARGARVINISIAAAGSTPELESAVRYAVAHGVVVVAAAGNDRQPGQVKHGPFYPASYPGVLSVGAIAPGGAPALFTDTYSGAGVAAPGADITTAWPGGYYQGQNGTSFAAPVVSGVAALLLAQDPRLTPTQVVARIEGSADGGTGPGTGAGLVNPVQALTAMQMFTGPSTTPAVGRPMTVRRPPPANRAAHQAGLELTGAALGLAAIIAAVAGVMAAARRRPAG